MSSFYLSLQILRAADGEPAGDPVGLQTPYQLGAEAVRWKYLLEENEILDPDRIEMNPLWQDKESPEIKAMEFATSDRKQTVELDVHRLFAPEAKRCSSRLVTQRILSEGERYNYRITAHHRGNGGSSPPADAWLQYDPSTCGAPPPRDATVDEEFYDQRDFEVFCEAEVLVDAVALAREAGEEEAGSLLLGHLLRPLNQDNVRPFLYITALVRASGGNRGRASFEFTPQSFNRARAVIEERARGEVMVGWQHNHPDFCNPKCPPEKREICALRQPFLSDHDLFLHETVFPTPYHLALLVSDDGKKLTPSLWGWRDGFVTRRSFQLTSSQNK